MCLPMESAPKRTGSIVGGKSIPRKYPGLNKSMNLEGGDNEESI
jgi:hypothetical protein